MLCSEPRLQASYGPYQGTLGYTSYPLVSHFCHVCIMTATTSLLLCIGAIKRHSPIPLDWLALSTRCFEPLMHHFMVISLSLHSWRVKPRSRVAWFAQISLVEFGVDQLPMTSKAMFETVFEMPPRRHVVKAWSSGDTSVVTGFSGRFFSHWR